jgi:hypothetical protein
MIDWWSIQFTSISGQSVKGTHAVKNQQVSSIADRKVISAAAPLAANPLTPVVCLRPAWPIDSASIIIEIEAKHHKGPSMVKYNRH